MNKVAIELEQGNPKARKSLKRWLLEKAQAWINGALEAEMTEHLQRGRYQPLAEGQDNYRNGYRPRRLNLCGLGQAQLKVPRDRQGTFQSVLLPDRRGQDAEFEAFIAECFLAGLSTRDISRISAKHFGQRYDSKQVSRLVARAGEEMDAWQQRSLKGRRFKFLFVDGANFKVRIHQRISKQSFCVVLGVSEEQECFEVLSVTMGDRENADLWGDVFNDLIRRGLDTAAVELGIMDGLPKLEEVFKTYFGRARTQRCQVHAKRNALRRVRKCDRPRFGQAVSVVFYAPSEAEARRNFYALKDTWQTQFPGAVAVIERDLDSLLTFYAFDPVYWATIRTTNPVERLNKEFKRRTRAMEVTGGEQATYRIMVYVAMTIEHSWSRFRLRNWAGVFANRTSVYTHDAA
jgi:putative transposase